MRMFFFYPSQNPRYLKRCLCYVFCSSSCPLIKILLLTKWSSKLCCFSLSEFAARWIIFTEYLQWPSKLLHLKQAWVCLHIKHREVMPWRTNKNSSVHFSRNFLFSSCMPCTFHFSLWAPAVSLLDPFSFAASSDSLSLLFVTSGLSFLFFLRHWSILCPLTCKHAQQSSDLVFQTML